MKKWFSVLAVFMFAFLFFAAAAGATGTLTATFMYNGSGIAGAYIYLHTYPSGTPIMGEYFRSAQYVLGPSDSNGNFSVNNVPAGTYRVRITRRAPLTASIPTLAQAYGPPRTGDYTWYDAGSTITVTNGSVTSLGSVYATIFAPGAAPITVPGKVTSGRSPASGWFVMATTAPCKDSTTDCGGAGCWSGRYDACNGGAGGSAVRYPAQQLTDSNGNYTIKLANPGTYYIYAMPSPGATAGSEVPASTCSNWVTVWDSIGYWNCPTSVSTGQNITGENIAGYY